MAVTTDVHAQAALQDPGSRAQTGATGSGLVAVEAQVDGGAIPIGATGQVVVLFRNEGGQAVQTGDINLYPSSNVSANVSLDQCRNEPLPSGAECAIAISVKGLQAGAWRVDMLMRHSGRSRLVKTILAGSVEASAEGADRLSSDLEAIPNDLDFGTLNASQSLIESVILRNITSTPIVISELYIDASATAGFELNSNCEKLQAGQACIITITWSPRLRGPASGVLVVKHDGPAALVSVPITGEFTPDSVDEATVFPEAVPGKGLLVSSQTEIDFGSDISTASAITVSLVNAGDAPINIGDIRVSGKDNGLGFAEQGCQPGDILEPIEACPLTVTWSPTRIGAVLDDIQVVHDGARGILVIPVRGTASSTVSQDQRAIVLSDSGTLSVARARNNNEDMNATPSRLPPPPPPQAVPAGSGPNAGAVLDGLRITSFSPNRAIIAGPGGSRIVFNQEQVVLGGVAWFVNIQPNGIEFMNSDQRVLLLFDRSLSSVNPNTGQSGGGGDISAPPPELN